MEEKLRQRPSTSIKIVLFGPESSGKSTLAEELANYYHAPLVPEYMRIYLQKKWDDEHKICEPEDIIPISVGQMQMENKVASANPELIICDTNLLQIKVYSEAYYNEYCDPQLLKPALNNQYHLYFLMYIDTPWTPDDLRDKPDDREGMFQRFKNELDRHNKNYVLLEGSIETRLQKAIKEIDALIKKAEK